VGSARDDVGDERKRDSKHLLELALDRRDGSRLTDAQLRESVVLVETEARDQVRTVLKGEANEPFPLAQDENVNVGIGVEGLRGPTGNEEDGETAFEKPLRGIPRRVAHHACHNQIAIHGNVKAERGGEAPQLDVRELLGETARVRHHVGDRAERENAVRVKAKDVALTLLQLSRLDELKLEIPLDPAPHKQTPALGLG
jgi:hypothetical protein